MKSSYQPRSSDALQPVPRHRRSGGSVFFGLVTLGFVAMLLFVAGYLAYNNSPGPTTCSGSQTVTAKQGDVLDGLISTYVRTSTRGYDIRAAAFDAKQMNNGHSGVLPGQRVKFPTYCSR